MAGVSGGQVITYRTVTVPVPESGVVRLPAKYPHDFASVPTSWLEITTGSQAVAFPMLDPGVGYPGRGVKILGDPRCSRTARQPRWRAVETSTRKSGPER